MTLKSFNRIQTEITIGDLTINFVKRYEIESSFDNFTDTAIVEVPRKVIFQKEQKRIEELINVGDKITIKRGYFPDLETRFEGYVARIRPNVVTTIECEDASWLCKRTSVNYSKADVTINQLINDNLPSGLTAETVDANVGKFRIKNATLAQVLEKVRQSYGLRSWFEGKTLICGLPYTRPNGVDHEVSFDVHVPLGKGDSLSYIKSDDVKLKVKATSILPDNSKLSVEVGDPDGEVRSFTTYNIKSVSELKKVAEANLELLKYTGFRGSFTIFGDPLVRHGDKIKITNKLNPLQFDGSFYAVKMVKEILDVSEGIRQEIELGQKVANL